MGSQGAGKSGIFLRFGDNVYYENYTATIGVDFKFKTLEVDHNQCKFQIWDTAGQERFRTITSAYYRGAHAIIIVHDLSNEESFGEIESYWINEVKTHASSESLIVLMGSKSDLERKTNPELIKNLADSLGVKSYEVSAKAGEGVLEAFESICRDLIRLNVAQTKSK